MEALSREKLYLRLHPLAMAALEDAHAIARRRGNAFVELAHWLAALLRNWKSDLHTLLVHSGIDTAAVEKDLLVELESYSKGASAVADFSAHIDAAVEKGWLTASATFGTERIRSGHIVVGLLQDAALARQLRRLSNQFRLLSVDRLLGDFTGLTNGSEEGGAGAPIADAQPGLSAPNESGVLGKYTVDLTAQARAGRSMR